MSQIVLYPLRFEPIYQYRLWGGRRLAELLTAPLPGDGPIGEAWIFSDRDDHASRVADGPLKGRTITQLMEQSRKQLLGKLGERFRRFPLLLKFLDAHEMLSVQVHPADSQTSLLPAGETGKTEAWVVLEAGKKSRIYAGLKPGTTADDLRRALANGTVAGDLAYFTPKPGDGVFLPAGTVHALGGDVVVFVELATPVRRERLFRCKQFRLWRLHGQSPFTVGAAGVARVLVCIEGAGQVEHGGATYAVGKGDVLLLPAVVGECVFRPGSVVSVLEIALPE